MATLLSLAALVPLQFGQATSGEILLALHQLASPIRVLYVAAHPDDENTQLLAYLEKERNVRAAYLSLTRGSGGQNLVGAEQGDVLGMMRTHELLGARSVDGAEQYFSRARDFGYSKSAEETISYWGHETILRDVVRVIRTFRPHVVITRFPEHGRTHGHHLASARLAHEAFAIAGSEDCFVDQLESLQPWSPERLFFNGRRWTGDEAPRNARRAFTLETGGYNPMLGASYGELAARGRSHHASQGFGSVGRREGTREQLFLLEGEVSTDDPFGGLRSEWSSDEGRRALAAIEAARDGFDAAAPEGSVQPLLRALGAVRAMERSPFREEKRAQLEALIAQCAGLFIDVRADADRVLPGGQLSLTLEVRGRGQRTRLVDARFFVGEQALDAEVRDAEAQELTLSIPSDATASVPYWLESPAAGAFDVADRRLVGSPLGPPPLYAEVRVQLGAETLTFARPIRHVWADRVRGERSTRVVVASTLTLTSNDAVEVIAAGQSRELNLSFRASAPASGTLRLPAAEGYTITPSSVPLRFERAGETQQVRVRVEATRDAAPMTLTPDFRVGERSLAIARESRIDHDHIPTVTLLRPAAVRIAAVNAAPYTGRIAYLQGAGDRVPTSLRQMGIEVQELSLDELRSEPLEGFSAVVLGVRAYNTTPALRDLQEKLFAYVEGGGVLLTQYNTNSWFGRLGDTSVGPHPMTISRDRVTNELATVEREDDPVLRAPNEIADADFAGWVQERGLYFASEWSDAYRTPLRIADPGEGPSSGSLLIADVGRGRFVYTGLSFFRQLPAGVPGAYRLFLNLISPR